MTTEQKAAQQYQPSPFELFIDGLSSKRPNFFRILLAAESVGRAKTYNTAFEIISNTGIHHPDFCQLVIHHPDAFNPSDYANYLDEFLHNDSIPDASHPYFNKAISIIWPKISNDYLITILKSILSKNEALARNAAKILIEIYPHLSSINAVLTLNYLIHKLEHEVASHDDILDKNSLSMAFISDILHFAFPKCQHINMIIANYFNHFLNTNNPLLKKLYEKILISAISTLKAGSVLLLFKEFEKAYEQCKHQPIQLIPLLKFIHALPINNDELANHAKKFFDLLSHHDFIIKQETLKVIVKHFKKLSPICTATQIIKLVDTALALEERFPEEFLRYEIQPGILESFSENLTPLQRTIAHSYLISIIKDTSDKVTELYKLAALRLLHVICSVSSNEAITSNNLWELLHTLKSKYESAPCAANTQILSLPALLKTRPAISSPLLKVYRKHITLFFTDLRDASDERTINRLCYDFELYYDVNIFNQVLSLFITTLQQKDANTLELHPWRMTLINKLVSSKLNHPIVNIIFALLRTLHVFEGNRDKEEYALALLQLFKSCTTTNCRQATIELFSSLAESFNSTTGPNIMQKYILTLDISLLPEMGTLIAACLKCVSVPNATAHLIQTLDNINQQHTLTRTQKYLICLGVLRELPTLFSIDLVKRYLEPNASTHQQQYIELAYCVLNLKEFTAKQTTPNIAFFPLTKPNKMIVINNVPAENTLISPAEKPLALRL